MILDCCLLFSYHDVIMVVETMLDDSINDYLMTATVHIEGTGVLHNQQKTKEEEY